MMAKRNLEDSLKRKWKCTECGATEHICEHIEALLPSENSGQFFTSDSGKRARIMYVDDLDQIMSHVNTKENLKQEESDIRFRELLTQAPLSDIERDVLRDKMMHNLTDKVIAENRKFVGGARRVNETYHRAIRKLKEYFDVEA